MKVKLTPQLKQFIEAQIKIGRFENASGAICDGIRLLEQRGHVVANLQSSFAPLGSMGDGDIMAMAFIVLMEAAKSAQEDLRAIMAGVKAINAAKRALRDLITQINNDAAENASQRNGKPPLKFGQRGVGSESGYHRMPVPHPDPESPGGVRRVMRDMHKGPIADVCVLRAIRDELKNDLDSMSEMGEMESLRLQMAMDRLSKMMSTLSNVLKKISDTQSSIIGNLK